MKFVFWHIFSWTCRVENTPWHWRSITLKASMYFHMETSHRFLGHQLLWQVFRACTVVCGHQDTRTGSCGCLGPIWGVVVPLPPGPAWRYPASWPLPATSHQRGGQYPLHFCQSFEEKEFSCILSHYSFLCYSWSWTSFQVCGSLLWMSCFILYSFHI